jgi:hypothetical protein
MKDRRRRRERTCEMATALMLLLLLAAGCSGGSPGDDPKTALLRAARRTLAAKSFHIETVATYDGADHRAEVDYLAPDRIQMRSFGKGAAISIFIGRDFYSSDFEDLDRFFLSRSPCDVTIGQFVPALEAILYAEDVGLSRGSYTFTLDGETGGEARITDGYLSSLSFHYTLLHLDELVEEHHTLSRYGDDDISIEAPPAGQVSPEPGPEDVIVVDEGSPPPCP